MEKKNKGGRPATEGQRRYFPMMIPVYLYNHELVKKNRSATIIAALKQFIADKELLNQTIAPCSKRK